MNDRMKAGAIAVLVLAGTFVLLLGYAALVHGGGTAAATDGLDRVETAVNERAESGQPVLIRESAPQRAYDRLAAEYRNECADGQDILVVSGEREGGVVFYEGRIETDSGTREVYAIDTFCEGGDDAG